VKGNPRAGAFGLALAAGSGILLVIEAAVLWMQLPPVADGPER
jgi:hypothetical protein